MKQSFRLAMLCTALWAVAGPVHAGEFEDALTSAYDTNPRIKAQRRVLEQADERVSQAIANFRPDIAADYSTGRQRTRFDTDQWSYDDATNKSITVSQPIFKGGSNYFRYSSAKNRVLAGREDLTQQEQGVMLDAVRAYMDVVQNESVLRLSQSNQDVLKKQLDASRNRFEVGDVTRTDVAQSQARLARSQADAIQAQGDLDSAVARFEQVMGYKPQTLALPMPENLPTLPANLEEAVEIAQKNNPEIGSYKYQRESAEDDIGANVGTLLPQVDLVGSMRRQEGAGVTGSSEFDTDSLMLNVNIPLYQRGAEYSRVREAKIVEKRREYDVRDTQDRVRAQTVDAWEDLQTAVSTIEAQEQAIESAQIALEGVRQEQQYGARTILDVLDAEQELFLTRVNHVRAQRNRIVAIYTLLQVMGDLSVSKLALNTKPHDPEKHYDSVKWQLIGF